MFRRTELRRGCTLDAGYVARYLDDSHLHAEADPEIWNAPFTCEGDSSDLAFRPSFAEPSRYQDAVDRIEMRNGILALEHFGIDPVQVHLHPVGDTAVRQCFVEGFVGVRKARVLAHNRDGDFVFGIADTGHDPAPGLQTGRIVVVDGEGLEDLPVKARLMIGDRHLINRVDIERRYDG